MTCTLLGTGTSHGIPVIGCSCQCCASSDPRDKRLRASAWIQSQAGDSTKDAPQKSTSIVLDVGPDFRTQALRAGIVALDAVFLSHSHADHLHGLDDVRVFSHTCPKQDTDSGGLPLYSNTNTLSDVRARFSYVFAPPRVSAAGIIEGGGKPHLSLIPAESFTPEHPLVIGRLEVVYIPLAHGSITAAGWVISETQADTQSPHLPIKRSIAYLTDCNAISDSSIERIHQASGVLEHVVLDGLRQRSHSTHLNFDEALAYAEKIGGKQTWLTHICHDMTHDEITAYLSCRNHSAQNVLPAYDGIVLQ